MVLMRERERDRGGGRDRQKKILEEKEGLINFNFILEKFVILIIQMLYGKRLEDGCMKFICLQFILQKYKFFVYVDMFYDFLFGEFDRQYVKLYRLCFIEL